MSKNSITAAGYPDRGANNDRKPLVLAFHHQGPTFINAFGQTATNVVKQD